ncbi:MAG: DUF1501 domain-containing protein, partial [Fuerstia sp.]|nr:DUF1501 domain-containing protein [Fuerstiella sp.]
MPNNLCSRRHLLQSSAFGLSSLGAAWLMKQDGLLAQETGAPPKPPLEPLHFDLLPKRPPHPARAKAMIS